MDDGTVDDAWVRIVVPRNGIDGEPPVRIKVRAVCECGTQHNYVPPDPQIGEWYTWVEDPCKRTITYTSIWENRIPSSPSSGKILVK